MIDQAILNDLRQFDDDFQPSNFASNPGLSELSDGMYEMEILSAGLEKTKKSGDTILKIVYRIASRNAQVETVEQAYFFKTQQNADILGSDLAQLGFDTSEWKAPKRPLSKELPLVLPKLKGILLKAEKKTTVSKKDGKTYHNLSIKNKLTRPSAPGTYPTIPATAGKPTPEGEDLPF